MEVSNFETECCTGNSTIYKSNLKISLPKIDVKCSISSSIKFTIDGVDSVLTTNDLLNIFNGILAKRALIDYTTTAKADSYIKVFVIRTVVSVSSSQVVISSASRQTILAVTTNDEVVTSSTVDLVLTFTAPEGVITSFTRKDVFTGGTKDEVVSDSSSYISEINNCKCSGGECSCTYRIENETII